jgi:hypothetical protein
MSKRTRNLLIIALVLFLCCFGGSIGNPFGSDDDSGANPIVDLLGRFASKGTPVPDTAIRAQPSSCRTGPNTFRFTGSCTLHVEKGGTGLRNLVLTTERAMTVSSTVPRKDFTVSDNVDAGKEVKVAVDERGGAVRLTCAPLQTCVVTRGD